MLPARHALLIGVPGCDNKDLFEPIPEQVIRRDVTRMARSLAQSQYEITVLGVAPDADTPIGRHIAEVPSRNRCLDEIQAACEGVPAGGTLIIYFTGHGVRVDGADFLVPQDYTRLTADGRHRRDRLIPVNFSDEVTSCRASLLLCVVDACRDQQSGEDSPTSSQSVPELPAGAFVLLRGCAPDETCLFDPGQGSLFTRALARALHRNESPQTLGQVIQATKDKLRAQNVAQHPRAVSVGEFTSAVADKVVCVGVRLLDDWRTAVEKTPLWGLTDEPEAVVSAREAVRGLVARYGTTVGGQRRRLEESSQLADVWSDDGYPERVLNGLYLLLTVPGRERPRLRAAEVAVLVVAPFFREAVLSLGLFDVPRAEPRDLERRFGSGFRSDFENILANNEQLARRGAGLAERHPQDRDVVAMWLVHRWILEREDLWESAPCRQWSSELARAVLQGTNKPAGEGLVTEFADTLRTMVRSVATVLGPAGAGLPEYPVRARALGHLLSIAGVLGGDPRRMTGVLADHVGTHDPVDLRRLRDAMESDARWTWGSDMLIMDAVCDHPAVHACLEDLVAAADAACMQARKAAATMPAENNTLLAGVPKRCDENLRPQKSAYDKPLLRFHLAGDRVRDLLMGTQLYGDAAVAVRELYQNALDACRYRHMRLRGEYGRDDPPNWNGRIVLRQGVEEGTGRAYIDCEDNGVGMTESILRHAFTAAGTRFVHTEAFRREAARWREVDRSYRLYPNSQFGIGVFSYFMLADEVFLWTAATDERGLNVESSLHLQIPGHGGLFRLRRDVPMPATIRSGGSLVRLYLSGGLDVSVTTLRDYLVVSDYEVEIWRGGDRVHSWQAGVPSGADLPSPDPFGVLVSASTAVEPRRGADNFWWTDGEGGRLADGLRVRPHQHASARRESERRYGRLVNLAGPHQPRLSVNREHIVYWDRRWADRQARSAIPMLAGWPGFTWAWLWQLGGDDRALAAAIIERHADATLPVTTESGSLTGVVSAVGYAPLDAELLSGQVMGRVAGSPSRTPAFMAPWRLAVWREASGRNVESPGIQGLPVDISGFPTPTTADDAALTGYYEANRRIDSTESQEFSLFTGSEISIDGAELLYRLRRLVMVGFDLSPLQHFSHGTDFEVIAAVVAHPSGMTPLQVLALAAQTRKTVAETYRLVVPRPLDADRPSLTEQEGRDLDFVPTKADLDLLRHRMEGRGRRTELSPAHVAATYVERGMSPDEARRRIEALRRIGLPFRRWLPPADDPAGPLAERVENHLTSGMSFSAKTLTELAFAFHTSESEVYDVGVRKAEKLGLPLRGDLGEGLPVDVPSEHDCGLASSVGESTSSGLIDIVAYRITNLLGTPPSEWASFFTRNTHLVLVPGRITGAHVMDLANDFDTTVRQAALLIRDTFDGWRDIDVIDPIPPDTAPLRPSRDEIVLLLRTAGRTPTWAEAISVEGVVQRALPRTTVGDVIDQLALYRPLGANVPQITEELAAYRPDEYDHLALAEARADGAGVTAIDLVRCAGRFGWTVRAAYDRLHRFASLGVRLSVRREDCPETIVHWADLIVLSRHFDGAAPGLSGTVTAEQIRHAAEAVREEPRLTRDRLRRYAALFGIECEESA